MKRPRIDARAWGLIIAIAIYAVHASLLAGWVVDDAGITFAYAKNLAEGHGLVAQSGHQPVEGFSNPLWTFVMAGLYWTGVFADGATAKMLGGGLVIAVIVLVWGDLRRCRKSPAATAVPLLLIAACTPFVAWTTSGLENPMLALLVVCSALFTIRASSAAESSAAFDVAAGLVAGLAAMTRPDAIVYAALYPLTVIATRVRTDGMPSVVRRAVVFVGAFAVVFGLYLFFRVAYFGAWVPNTFFAKPKPSLGMASPGKLLDLLESATGDLSLLVALFLVAAFVGLLATGRLAARMVVLLAYLSVSTLLYLVMPADWMGEFRFATTFFPLFFWVLADLGGDVFDYLKPRPALRRVSIVVVLVFVAQQLAIFAGRSLAFAERPTVPLAEVEAYAGDGFNHLARVIGVSQGSLLTPDLGGALLNSRLRVYDLAGLCDERIARAIDRGDLMDLHRYVFDDMKPTFIHTHGAFTRASRLYEDPRFQRDYVAIYEHVQGPPEWTAAWGGRTPPPWSGDYVRRDALGVDGLDLLLAEYRRLGLDQYVPWTRPDDRLKAGWPQVAWALETVSRHIEHGPEDQQ